MNRDLDLDRILAAWLSEGTERAPEEDVAAGLRAAARTRQRHGFLERHAGVRLQIPDLRWMAAGVLLAASVGAVLVIGHPPAEAAGRTVTEEDFPWTATDPAPALDDVAFVVRLPPDAPERMYWRAATYDRFDLGGWSQSAGRLVDVPAGAPLPSTTDEDPDGPLTATLRVTIEPEGFRARTVLSPGRPLAVDADTTALLVGDPGGLSLVELDVLSAYTVDAAVLRPDDSSAISADRLRVAGRDYPAGIVVQYTDVPPDAIGPDAKALLESILDSTPERNPYDLAVAVESTLTSGRFRYSTDVGSLACTDPSAVECLARSRAGYCLYFASTMAILLRAALPDDPIPTRLVQGYLPGARRGGVETVTQGNAHAWVEVYFPGDGWIPFDPTPRGSPATLPLPTGD